MSQQALSEGQFQGFAGGPAEASQRAGLSPHRDLYAQKPQGEQGQLFNPESIPPQEAHQQTPDRFAQDPRTWWHGRVTKGGPQGRLGGSGIGRGEGFHAGSIGAARARVTTNVRARGVKEGMAGRLYPLRITGPVEGPENLHPDVTKHYELGPSNWRYGQNVGGRKSGYLYHNVVEGGSGEVSVGVPQRKGFLSTQREMVTQAQKEGKYVHPNIAWAAKGPEHTTEKIEGRYAHPTPEDQRYAQPMLQEQFKDTDPHKGAEIARQMYPETHGMARASYQTESGRTQHVWRYRDSTPGSALLSKQQWMPSS